MRTLSATLTTAQQAASGTPYLELVLTSPDGLTTYTFKSTDATPRIRRLDITEGAWGSSRRPVIRLLNNDQYFSSLNLKGYKAVVKWGYNTTLPGNESSSSQPMWVYVQREMSEEGVLYTELELVDLWWRLSKLRVVGGGIRLTGTIVGTFTLSEGVTGLTGSALRVLSIGTNHILVTGVTGTFTNTQVVTGNSSGATITLTEDAGSGGGVGAAPTWTNTTIYNIIASLIADVANIQDDTAGADARLSDTPEYTTNDFDIVLGVVRMMIQLTSSMLRMENDGKAHVRYMTTPGSPDYSYDASHVFFKEAREQILTIPNKIFVVDNLPPEGTFNYYGVATDAVSLAAIGPIPKVIQDSTVTSNAEAALAAATILLRVQEETTKGEFEAPMNCGQEVLDWVSIVDSRANITITGRVSLIRRIWEPGKYVIDVQLGGLLDDIDLSSPEALITSLLNYGYGRAVIPGGMIADSLGGSVSIAASQVTYTPATPTNWTDPDPTEVKTALDRIAAGAMVVYPLLAGRAGGQVLIGGLNSGDDLKLQSTANLTKGSIFLGLAGVSAYDEVNERLGIGTPTPSVDLHVYANVAANRDMLYIMNSGLDGTAGKEIVTARFGKAPATNESFAVGFRYVPAGNSRIGFTVYGDAFGSGFVQEKGGAVGIATETPLAKLHVVKDNQAHGTDTSWGLAVGNLTTPAKRLGLGYDTDADAGFIQAVQAGVAWKNLIINPSGGYVGIRRVGSLGASLDVGSLGTTDVLLKLWGYLGQAVNMLEVIDASPAVISRFDSAGRLATTVYIDLSSITAGLPNLKITATTDTPSATWGAATETIKVGTAPAGWMEIDVGGIARYIPFWA